MRTLMAFMLAYPRRSALMLVALLVAGAAEGLSLTTMLPLLSIATGNGPGGGIGKSVTGVLQHVGLSPTLGLLLVVIVVGMVIKSILLLIANQQVGYTVAHVATSLRLNLIDALLACRWEYFLRQQTGALANAVATEAYRASISFENGATVIALALQASICVVVALLVSWKAALASLLVGIAFSAALHHLVRASRRAGAKQTRLLRSLLSFLTDVLGSVKSLKAMARDDVANAVLRDQNAQLEVAMRHEVMSRETLRALQEPMLAALASAGLYVVLVLWGLPLPSVMMLLFLLVRILNLTGKVQRQYQFLVAHESAYWALRDAAEDARCAAERRGGSQQVALARGIEFRGVQFQYGARPVFRGLDLSFPAGSLTAVIGPSGIGKSTMLDLLCGLVEPAAGEILVDGVHLRDLDTRNWRRMIGYVPQEAILLHDSILNNVLAGEADLTDADAEQALRDAGAWEFVCALPEGMRTVIGERGSMLSGGQRQRVTIARALAHHPRLLLLDEPTSALDPVNERLICETLRDLAGRLTVIVVSHQPALVEIADQVYAIEEGRIRGLSKPAPAHAGNAESPAKHG